MEIKLYRMTCEKNRVNKTDFLTLKTTVSGTLKAPTSILNPVVTLELPYEDYFGVNVLPEFNYAFIRELGFRYYFVNDIQVINGLFVVYLAIDVLHTFRNMIGDASAMVERNEFEYDDLLRDEMRTFKETHQITSRNMSTAGSLVNFSFDVETSGVGTRTFIVGLLQDVNSPLYTDYEPAPVSAPTGTNLPDISARRRSEGLSNAVYYCVSYSSLKAIAKAVFNNDTKQSFVISCVAVPFNVDSNIGRGATSQEVLINNERVETAAGVYLSETFYVYGSESAYLIVADETFTIAQSYMDFEPYTRVSFFLPFYGEVEVAYERISGKRIIVFYTMNAGTGEGSVNIYSVTDNAFIFQASCTLGLRLSLNTSNALELQNARSTNSINTALGVLGSMISTAGGFATGNPVAIGGGMISLAKTVAGGFAQEINLLPRANVSTPSTNAGAHGLMSVRVTFTKIVPSFDTVSDVESYAHAYGLPLRQPRTLSTMRGLTTVSEVHLKETDAATVGITFPMSSEYDMIAEQLRVGVLFPEP